MRVLAIAAVLAAALYGQLPVPAPSNTTAPAAQTDPLGRSTPRGTLVEFLRAAQERGDAAAVPYLESSGGRAADPANRAARTLAGQLKAVLDSTTSLNLNEVSNEPQGALDDALPPDVERIASIQTRTGAVEIRLHRVTPRGGAPIWLFSFDTLREVPAAFEDLAPPALEQFLPHTLVVQKVLDVALWRWLALLVLIPIVFGLACAIVAVGMRLLTSVTRHTRVELDDRIVPLLRGPLRLFLAVALFHPAMVTLELPLLLRQGLGQVEVLLGVVATAWFAMRLIDLASAEARRTLVRKQRVAAVSIVPLGRRIVKVAAIALACLIVLDNAGFDLKTILTGLGIGGIAVALAAQRTLENVFGAFALVLDQPVRVGDFCKFNGNIGTVEDIGLRSTRIRTLDRTVICVPNAQFSMMNIENFGPREKVWFHPAIALRLDTTAAQAEQILTRIRELLKQHPKMEPAGRVNLSGFGQASINLEIFAYVATGNYDEFVVIQEELLLRIMRIIEEAGTSIALPAQSGYLSRGAEQENPGEDRRA